MSEQEKPKDWTSTVTGGPSYACHKGPSAHQPFEQGTGEARWPGRLVGRFWIAFKWCWTWKNFTRCVLMHNETTFENTVVDGFAWTAAMVGAIVAFPILVSGRLVVWMLAPFVAPFKNGKPFFDMLERQNAKGRDSSPNTEISGRADERRK